MHLAIISNDFLSEHSYIKQLGLNHVELDFNPDTIDTLHQQYDEIKTQLKISDICVDAVGVWGLTKINDNGIDVEVLKLEKETIRITSILGSKVYICGCNWVEGLSEAENISYTISYLNELVIYANQYDVQIAIYNCDWNNYLYTPYYWDLIFPYIDGIKIKYDASHAFYRHHDYLMQIKEYGSYFAHVHLKGALQVDGERVDDPPAGLDQIDWNSVLSLLYYVGYQGSLSIEPHSSIWQGELGKQGVIYTKNYFTQRIMEGI